MSKCEHNWGTETVADVFCTHCGCSKESDEKDAEIARLKFALKHCKAAHFDSPEEIAVIVDKALQENSDD